MSNTTRRDAYRMAALTGLLANPNLALATTCAHVEHACTIGDLMESRAKADYEKRENGGGKREEPAVKTCETCQHRDMDMDVFICAVPCTNYTHWQPKEADDVHTA